MRSYENSKKMYAEAVELIPGGVNSPVRAFQAVGDFPIFVKEGHGAHIIDVDDNEYVDYICSWGPLILGHRPAAVTEALKKGLETGTTFGIPTEIETEMARFICEHVPSIEMVRMVSSGTEATMSALRLARAYTGREKIMKFEGCYHGHADHLLIKAGSGALTLGVPSTPGVPESIAGNTLNAKYNDLASVEELFVQYDGEIAAIIVEPIAGNMGLVPPKAGFLQGLRDLCDKYGAILIFDEVISGFRASLGGAQELYGITPDLTCLGKIIGGGLPVGAYGGKKEIMRMVAPAGPVYQAGTLSGNPLAMAAGLAALHELTDKNIYGKLEHLGSMLAQGLKEAADEAQVPVSINFLGSLLTVFFTDSVVECYQQSQSSNTARFKVFYQAMLAQGFYLPPSQFECWFISAAHSEEDIRATIAAAKIAFQEVKKSEE